jgi:hypothetical protein
MNMKINTEIADLIGELKQKHVVSPEPALEVALGIRSHVPVEFELTEHPMEIKVETVEDKMAALQQLKTEVFTNDWQEMLECFQNARLYLKRGPVEAGNSDYEPPVNSIIREAKKEFFGRRK